MTVLPPGSVLVTDAQYIGFDNVTVSQQDALVRNQSITINATWHISIPNFAGNFTLSYRWRNAANVINITSRQYNLLTNSNSVTVFWPYAIDQGSLLEIVLGASPLPVANPPYPSQTEVIRIPMNSGASDPGSNVTQVDMSSNVGQTSISLTATVLPNVSNVLIDFNIDDHYTGQSARTDSSGRASVSVATSNYTAGVHTAKAYLDSYPTVSGLSVFTINQTQTGVGSIRLSAASTLLTDAHNVATLNALIKDKSGQPLPGISPFLIIDGVQGNTPQGASDGSGVVPITVTFTGAVTNHTIAMTAGGVTSNSITFGPNGGSGGGGIFGNLPSWAWIVGAGIVVLAASSRRGGGSKVIRI